jgi:hypothetical protein
MTQFQGTSKVENIVSNILDNSFLTTNRYVAEFRLPKVMADENPIMPNMMIRCMSVTIPGRNISTTGYRIYGPARQMPYEILYGGEITLNYILSRDMTERRFFEKWMGSVVNNNDYKLGYYDDYVGTLAVHVLDKSDQVAYVSLVEEVYPKMIGDLSFANDRENEYLTQEITFGFRKYTSAFYVRQFPEYNGGEFPAPNVPKNNGNGLGIAALFQGIGEGAGNIMNGIGSIFSPKKA